MRAVVQRVAQASVTGGGETASISRGLCVLVGFESSDTTAERDALLQQLFKLRLFPKPSPDGGEPKPWSGTAADVNADILLVSQFTLNAVLKSGRPSFHRAMPPGPAKEMWGGLVEAARGMYTSGIVRNCVFGSMMNVSIVNEGPVTICLTSVDGKCSAW